MSKPFFSVIIPTYNRCVLLNKAIKSVFDQKFKDFEIVIIDSNSTDDTEKTVKSFDQGKIIYKKIGTIGNIAKSRNEAITNSNGTWLAFLDSDDEWHEDKLEETYFVIKNNNIQVVCTNMWIAEQSSTKKQIYRYGPYTNEFYKTLLIFGNCISTSSSVVNKNFIMENHIKFNERQDFISTEDFDFFLNISRKKGKFFFLNAPLGKQFIHSQGISANLDKHYKALFAVLNEHVFKIQNFTEKKEKLWSQVEANYKFRFILQKYKFKKMEIADLYQIIKILIQNPKNIFTFALKILKNKFLNNFTNTK